jgi:Domain of unknown function (DUF4129)
MSRQRFPLIVIALSGFLAHAVLTASGAWAQGFDGKSKAPPMSTESIRAARDKAVRAYDFQTDFPGATDEERRIARAAPMKIVEEPKVEENKTPEWLKKLGRIMGPVMRVLGWVLLTGIVLALLYYAASAAGDWRFGRKEKLDDDSQTMTPMEFGGKRAKDWLAEAEALAAQGRYAEAVHFLLFSSFEDIRRRLQAVLRPAWTSREILRDVPMRPSATAALNVLVETVEDSEFAGRSISADDFSRCRDTYARFVSEVAA